MVITIKLVKTVLIGIISSVPQQYASANIESNKINISAIGRLDLHKLTKSGLLYWRSESLGVAWCIISHAINNRWVRYIINIYVSCVEARQTLLSDLFFMLRFGG